MCNYNFEILQYNEFENLTRDLLQAEFGVFIESFKDGKDGGIDLRFGLTKGKKCIVQVKRYKTYSSLKTQLEKELEKVKKLNPSRYILSTSVPLSPANKEEIKGLFGTYIQNTEDIFGRDDINNLLTKHPEVEKRYYKLWLGSTEILQEIIHKNIRNWSRFELNTIHEEVKTYVSNESFNEALRILRENHYVIISGIPGIGKTTLARMLVYHLLAQSHDEFVCIEDNLHDGASLFQEGKKQVFFFDDFLGAITLELGEKDFEKKLLSFINAVKRESGKLFIMTTREYILSQAKEHFEQFQIKNIEIAKCIVDLGVYNEYIRAQILYNHIAEAHLPDAYIEQLLANNNYKSLVNHRYFNPRVIEAYIDGGLWKNDPPEHFVASFTGMFDNPANVWESAFSKLPAIAQYALLVLGTMSKEVYESDWQIAFFYFCQETRSELKLSCTQAEWERYLKILEDCFVRFDKTVKGKLIVRLYNPSVLGFIVAYVNKYQDVQRQLLAGSKYVEQLYSIFKSKRLYGGAIDAAYVFLKTETAQLSNDRLKAMLVESSFSACGLLPWNTDMYRPIGKTDVLFHYSTKHEIANGYREQFVQIEDFEDRNSSFLSKVRIAEWLDWKLVSISQEAVARMLMRDMENVDDAWLVIELLDNMHMDELLEDKAFLENVNILFDSEIDNATDNLEATEVLTELVERIARRLPEELFPSVNYLSRISEKEDMLNAAPPDYDEDFYGEREYGVDETDKAIYEMMTSLRYQNQDTE